MSKPSFNWETILGTNTSPLICIEERTEDEKLIIDNFQKIIFKPAVITPYYKENLSLLKRCHESCASQSKSVNHFFVADGFPKEEIKDWDVEHIILSKSHSDYGNTPRSIGALSAINKGYNVIFFLDADNWYEENHVEEALKLKQSDKSLDIVASCRKIFLPCGTLVGSEQVDYERKHIDTNCMIFFESSFFLLPFWATMTKELSVIGDRIMRKQFLRNRLKIAYTEKETVNYTSNYKNSYIKAGLKPPKDAYELDLSCLKQFSEKKFFNWNRFIFNNKF